MLHPDDPSHNETFAGAAKEIEQPKNAFHRGATAVFRMFLAGLGFLLIPLGLILGPLTPFIPLGLTLCVAGAVLISRNSVWGRRLLQSILARYPKYTKFIPDWLLRMIFGDDMVRPDHPKAAKKAKPK